MLILEPRQYSSNSNGIIEGQKLGQNLAYSNGSFVLIR